jgi:exodeoxyribonuclease-3
MRIVTLNVNGLRSAAAKGLMPWVRRQKADVVCLQEIKAHEADLPKRLIAPRGLHAYFHPAEKRGYSGVAIYAKREPDRVTLGLGVPDIDAQGRYLQLDFARLSVGRSISRRARRARRPRRASSRSLPPSCRDSRRCVRAGASS